MKNREQTQSLKEIRNLLSHLHGEIAALEANYTEVLSVLKQFEHVANIDDLTGLLRRNTFFARWNEVLARCQEVGENCGVLMIDIDHFKKINDTYGHPTGDEVIKRVAQLLKQYESPNGGCFVARLGGEEFAVAIRGSDAEIRGIAEFIRRGAERLSGPVVGDESLHWSCTVSVGMATSSSVGHSSDALIQSADAALYKAKQSGRNRVQAA